MKYIIIPDVHGRKFWRPVIEEYVNQDVKFIFLGDYLDPYDWEGIEDEFKELTDIITYKKQYPDKFILLLGNHDLHYLSKEVRGSRWDFSNSKRNREKFMDNLDLFQLTYTAEVAGKIFYFSHAGVNQDWINFAILDSEEDENGIITFDKLPDFNKMFKDEETRNKFFTAAGWISMHRGGGNITGSIVWADYHDHLDKALRIPGIIQVFGHTQQESEPLNFDNELFCLDVRRYFILTEDGKILDSKTNEEIPVADSAPVFEESQKKLKKLLALYSMFF
jgi:hypothetical protein